MDKLSTDDITRERLSIWNIIHVRAVIGLANCLLKTTFMEMLKCYLLEIAFICFKIAFMDKLSTEDSIHEKAE